jgi:catabolite regulation protein CreA
MFRDVVRVTAVPDPKINGITMFMSSVKDGRWKAKSVDLVPDIASI